MPFVSNLGKLMQERGMTYTELQYLSKIAPDTVAKARTEKIETCKLSTLEKIATTLDVDVTELFTYVRAKKNGPG